MKKLISFGFRHGGPDACEGVTVIDIRRWFNKNPYRNKSLRKLRGTDPEVQQGIQQTPRFAESLEELTHRVLGDPNQTIYLGCTGGHHRSVYAAELIGKAIGAEVEHRDFHKP